MQENDLIPIAKALQTSSTVKHLDFTSNHITDVASQEIASAITKNNRIQLLVLSDCALQETGLVNISQALCTISSLKHLDLSHNNITATIMASVITNNHAICSV